MIGMEFTFESTPWDAYRLTKQMGDVVEAGDLLTMLEDQSDQVLEDALQDMEEGCMELSIASLPKAALSGEAAVRLRQEKQLVKNGFHT